MALPEAKVLKARDHTVRDEDEWPEIPFTDVEVRDPRSGEPISLLHADTKKPLVLTGRLGSLSKDQSKLLLVPVVRTTRIEVGNVTRYAYGQFDDGSYVLWALGRAGWFEIRPSRAYSETYDDTVEAIEAFYFLKDTYAWDGEDVGHRQLFKKYAEEHKETMRNARDAAQLFYKHAGFLAKAMQKPDSAQTDGVDWTVTPFFEHLREKFPELFKTSSKPPSKAHSVRSASGSVSNGNRAARLRSSETASQKNDVSDNVSTTSSRRRVFTPVGPTPEELEAKGKALWKMMLDTYKKLGSDSEDLTLEAFAAELHIWYQFEDVTQASDYFCALAPQMLQHMDKSRGRNWTQTGVYEALQQAHVPAVTRKRVLLLDLESRPADEAEKLRRRHLGEEVEDSSSSEETSEDEGESPERPKSALRPQNSRFANKGAKRRGKSYRHSLRSMPESEQDEDESMADLTSPTKRKASAADAAITRPRKRAANEIIDIPDDESGDEGEGETESSDGQAVTITTALPLRRRTEEPAPTTNGTTQRSSRREQQTQHTRNTRAHPRQPSPPARAPIVTEELPSEEPNGPGGTWTCGEDGCTYKVYGAAKSLGKRLVREHIADHESRRSHHVVDEEAIALVRREEEMCNLPVSNLIKRIREVAATQDGLPDFPVPIHQRY